MAGIFLFGKNDIDLLLEEDWIQRRFNEYRSWFPDYSYRKARKHFFTPDTVKELKTKVLEYKNQEIERKRKEKEKYIRLRVEAYPYEDVIFTAFAPLMKEVNGEWYPIGDDYISKKDFIKELENWPQLDDFNYNELIELFLKKEFISRSLKGDDLYELGPTLYTWANVISEDDMNIDKWIKTHKY